MNCANHPDVPAAAYCRTCGKPLCVNCKREAMGTIFCEEHVPPVPSAHFTAPPYSASAPPPPAEPGSYVPPGGAPFTATAGAVVRKGGPSPGLAFLLGLIPGVGAIYNGQYAKGLIHAVVFGILISIINNHPHNGLEPLVAILMAVWFFYMAFEAYHTARKRREGERVDEFSSLVELNRPAAGFPAGAIVLIVLGALLLLDQTDIVPLERLIRYWPVGLILIGVYMIYARTASVEPHRLDSPALRDERSPR